MGRERGSQTTQPSVYATPREEYVCSPERPTITSLALKWKGTPGYSEGNLKLMCFRERWVMMRKEFWEHARDLAQKRIAEQAAGRIVEANDRHIQLGRGVQAITGQLVRAAIEQKDATNTELGPGERLRAVANMARVGVDIERKGLGLADQVVYVEAVREITRTMLVVIARYVTDPDIYGNIVHDLQAEASKAESGTADGLLAIQPLEPSGTDPQ